MFVFLVLSIRSNKKLLLNESIALISMQNVISNIVNFLHSWCPKLGVIHKVRTHGGGGGGGSRPMRTHCVHGGRGVRLLRTYAFF